MDCQDVWFKIQKKLQTVSKKQLVHRSFQIANFRLPMISILVQKKKRTVTGSSARNYSCAEASRLQIPLSSLKAGDSEAREFLQVRFLRLSHFAGTAARSGNATGPGGAPTREGAGAAQLPYRRRSIFRRHWQTVPVAMAAAAENGRMGGGTLPTLAGWGGRRAPAARSPPVHDG